MQTRIFGFTALAACVCALSLFSAPTAHAQQQQAKVIAQAKAVSDPWVLVFSDSPTASTIDDQQTKSFSTLLAGSDWYVLDNGQIVISKGQTLIGVGGFLTNDALSMFLVHGIGDGFKMDGWMYRSTDNPSQGWADVFITLTSKDKTSSVTVVYSDALAFATAAKR